MWHWNWYAMFKMYTCGYTTTYVSLFPTWEGCDYCWDASLQYCTEMHERGMSFKCVVSLHGIIHNMFNTAKSIVEYHAEQPSSFTYKWFRIFCGVFYEDLEVGIWLQSVQTSIVVMYHRYHCFKMKVKYATVTCYVHLQYIIIYIDSRISCLWALSWKCGVQPLDTHNR